MSQSKVKQQNSVLFTSHVNWTYFDSMTESKTEFRVKISHFSFGNLNRSRQRKRHGVLGRRLSTLTQSFLLWSPKLFLSKKDSDYRLAFHGPLLVNLGFSCWMECLSAAIIITLSAALGDSNDPFWKRGNWLISTLLTSNRQHEQLLILAFSFSWLYCSSLAHLKTLTQIYQVKTGDMLSIKNTQIWAAGDLNCDEC